MEQAVIEYLCANNWNDQLKMCLSGRSIEFYALLRKKEALAYAICWDATPQGWSVWNARHSTLKRISLSRYPDNTWKLTR